MMKWGKILPGSLNIMARRQRSKQAKCVVETEGSLIWLGISVWGVRTACSEVFEIDEEYDINF